MDFIEPLHLFLSLYSQLDRSGSCIHYARFPDLLQAFSQGLFRCFVSRYIYAAPLWQFRFKVESFVTKTMGAAGCRSEPGIDRLTDALNFIIGPNAHHHFIGKPAAVPGNPALTVEGGCSTIFQN
jgi:hypothetical protein